MLLPEEQFNQFVLEFRKKFSTFLLVTEDPIVVNSHLVIADSLDYVTGNLPVNKFLSRWKDNFTALADKYSVVYPTGTRITKRYAFAWPGLTNDNVLFEPEQENSDNFFGLLIDTKHTDKNIVNTVLVYCLYLATWAHLTSGGLSLHCSVVSYKNKGCLFFGYSGSGKSTIAELGIKSGYEVLGDDVNFLFPGETHRYVVASGPSVQPLDGIYSVIQMPVSGIFRLVKDSSDYLVPLSQKETAQVLWEGFIQAPHSIKFSHLLKKSAFQLCCILARTIPAYELHFRKSPDFWQLIDEQFPD